MFWGLIIEPGKKYSQTVENTFHISKATLDLSDVKDEDVTVMLDYEGQQEYILCHLSKTNKQESLDLNFQVGDNISLFTQGSSTIHLSGYLIGDDDDDMTLGEMMEEEEEEEEEEGEEEEEETEAKQDLRAALQAKAQKRAQPTNGKEGKAQKKAKVEMEVDDMDEEGEEEEEDAKPQQQLSKKQQKKLKQQQGGKPAQQPQKDAQPKPNQQDAKPSKQTLAGGLVVEDLKVGSGPEAKKGDLVAVYYKGTLQKNGKMFDQSNKGPGFKFKLGAGRVIKGWDMGIAGMKIGGKRKLIIPSQLAYGAGGAPPQIPPNSTLVFDVELKALN